MPKSIYYVDAIIRTEKFFRPLDKRIIEYVVIVIRHAFGFSYENMTVGVAQISFKYWIGKYGCGFWTALAKTLNYSNNREMVYYFAKQKNIPIENEKAFLIAYNGRPSSSYVKKFRSFLL